MTVHSPLLNGSPRRTSRQVAILVPNSRLARGNGLWMQRVLNKPLPTYQNVVLGVTDYGLDLTTMAQTNLLKLDRVQNDCESYWEPQRTYPLRP